MSPKKARPRPDTSSHPDGARRRVAHYLPDFVFGANDGIITTFAIVSGVAGASLSSRVVLILGAANLIADGLSMAASNYLSRRSAEDEADRDMDDAIRHGAVTFVGFVIAGVLPLLAYMLPVPGEHRYTGALVLALVALFIVGSGRSISTGDPWVRSGMEMLIIGAAAAAVAYGIGAGAAMVV